MLLDIPNDLLYGLEPRWVNQSKKSIRDFLLIFMILSLFFLDVLFFLLLIFFDVLETVYVFFSSDLPLLGPNKKVNMF